MRIDTVGEIVSEADSDTVQDSRSLTVLDPVGVRRVIDAWCETDVEIVRVRFLYVNVPLFAADGERVRDLLVVGDTVGALLRVRVGESDFTGVSVGESDGVGALLVRSTVLLLVSESVAVFVGVTVQVLDPSVVIDADGITVALVDSETDMLSLSDRFRVSVAEY